MLQPCVALMLDPSGTLSHPQASAPVPSHSPDLAGPPVLPSHFLREAIAGFLERLRQHQAAVAELEAALVGSGAAGWAGLGWGRGRCWWPPTGMTAGRAEPGAAGACTSQQLCSRRPLSCMTQQALGKTRLGMQQRAYLHCVVSRLKRGRRTRTHALGRPTCPPPVPGPAGYGVRRGSQAVDGLQALQGALTNVHDFLIHTAARLQVRPPPGSAGRQGWPSSASPRPMHAAC